MENSNNHFNRSLSETIEIIEGLGGKYDLDSALPISDQLLICEINAPILYEENFASNHQETENNNKANTSDSVKWNGNGTYNRNVITTLTHTKRDVIEKLKTFTYKTPPIEIAHALQTLFSNYRSKEGHWLYIAQHWNPRAINRVIEEMIKRHKTGKTTIQNPPAYFTTAIKFRKTRRSL